MWLAQSHRITEEGLPVGSSPPGVQSQPSVPLHMALLDSHCKEAFYNKNKTTDEKPCSTWKKSFEWEEEFVKKFVTKCQDGLPFYKNIIFNPKWQNYSVAKERWYLNKGQIKSGGKYNTWCIRILRIISETLWGPWQFYHSLFYSCSPCL